MVSLDTTAHGNGYTTPDSDTHGFYFVDNSESTVTFSLLHATTVGRSITVIGNTNKGHSIQVNAQSGDTILVGSGCGNGGSSVTLQVNSGMFVSDGNHNWYLLGSCT